jgi:hypothetical protein
MYKKIVNYWEEFRCYKLSDKVYGVGFAVIILYVVAMSVSIILFKSAYVNEIVKIFVSPSIYIFTFAVVLEYWPVILKLLKNKRFQWGLGILAILVYKFSEAYTDRFINHFVLNEPSYFPSAKSILTALYLPYSWLAVVSFFLALFVLFHWVFIPFERKSKVQYGGWKRIARFLGLLWVILYVAQAKFFFEDKNSLFTSVAEMVILYSEYYQKTHCQNVEQFELSAYLDRGYISIYDPHNMTFRTERCILDNED